MKSLTSFLTFVLLAWIPALGADREYANAAIKTRDGYIIILNKERHSFTLELKGKEVRATSQDQMYFTVDKRFVQVTATPIEQVNPKWKHGDVPVLAVLEAHRDWELEYMSKEHGEVLKSRSESLVVGEAQALWWGFDRPQNARGNVRRQLYVTRFVGGYIISIGGVAVVDSDDGPVRELLLAVMATLQDSPEPISLRKVQERVKQEAATSAN